MERKPTDIREADPETLVDISEIEGEEQRRKYVEIVKDSGLVRVGEYVVRISHADCEETLEDRVKEYAKRLGETWK
ncbi:MAG: hypothetical protein Q4D55_09805 [Eubacteriales bacterium]|nr:hypothetical protein [Eubacteriales bacterium]